MTTSEMLPNSLRQAAGFLGCRMRPTQALYHQFRIFFFMLQPESTLGLSNTEVFYSFIQTRAPWLQ
jgi:hypothetical protein